MKHARAIWTSAPNVADALRTSYLIIELGIFGVHQAVNGVELDLAVFATGFDQPVGIISPAGDDRLFVVEKRGVIRVLHRDGTVNPIPFLDITDRVDWSFLEEGLLGLAFSPDFVRTGEFYLSYVHTSEGNRRTRLARFSVGEQPNIADPESEEILLTVTQPEEAHNAGDLHFGLDGYLYVPLGDGGDFQDLSGNAQDLELLLGKIVRIDVESQQGTPPDCVGIGTGDYTIPPSNPLTDGVGGKCDEIWAIGLRNPWRSSFDRLTGDLFVADVGQDGIEEVNYQPAQSPGGENYGWRCFEGTQEFNLNGCDESVSYTFPIFEYLNHSEGTCAVIGGYRYRGAWYPDLVGRYFLTDYCSGTIWTLSPDGSGGWESVEHTGFQATGYGAFGEDNMGELYLVQYREGIIFRIEETSSLDFGDAPDPSYPVLSANQGARHRISGGLYLGSGITPEVEGQPSINADADLDDGVVFDSVWV